MSLSTEVATLTTAVDSIKSAVESAKPVLDEREVLGREHKATAQYEETTAKGYRDDVEAYKETAYNALRDIKSIAEQDISSVVKDLTENAVDVFVYDTSKDSDGGAWRHRTQDTSWYNEQLGTATRGYRKEFPAVALIVAYNGVNAGNDGGVNIYDATDPAYPLWMHFSGDYSWGHGKMLVVAGRNSYAQITSVTMKDAKLYVASRDHYSTSSGFFEIDFLKEQCKFRKSPRGNGYNVLTNHANIAARNEDVGISPRSSGDFDGTISSFINDVAVTTLDGAPIDPETNLPVPTIAVGTEGGVTVFKDDGNVFDIIGTNWGSKCDALEFRNDGILFFAQERYYLMSCDVKGLTEDLTGLQDGRAYRRHDLDSYPLKQVSGNNYIGFDLDRGFAVSTNDDFDVAYSMYNYYPHRRLVLSTEGSRNHGYAGDSQMSAYITNTYNSGWMHGDIKLATLASTTAETLPTSELLTNGTFDTDVSSWTLNGGDFQWDGSGKLERVQGDTNSSATQYINIVRGDVYKIEYDVTHTGGHDQTNVFIDTGSGYITLADTRGSAHVVDYFRAEGTESMLFRLYGINDFRGTFDNVSIKRVEPNLANQATRGARAGLNINGTIVKSAVASGAELMKYGGFTTNNYLTQDYNSDLNFGTGDFSISFWLKDNAGNSTSYVLERLKADGTTDLAVWRTTSSSTRQLRIQTNVGSVQLPTLTADQWSCINFVRRDGVIYGYVNGKLESTGSNLGNISSNQHLALGARSGGNGGNGNWGLSLFRISATAPTPEQIEKIYRDEKPLFQEGAKCTIHDSDTVRALDYDEDEQVLRVGTPDGTSVFSGLQRIENTTHAVTVAISASNGLVIEE
jgi:hypothetical protein